MPRIELPPVNGGGATAAMLNRFDLNGRADLPDDLKELGIEHVDGPVSPEMYRDLLALQNACDKDFTELSKNAESAPRTNRIRPTRDNQIIILGPKMVLAFNESEDDEDSGMTVVITRELNGGGAKEVTSATIRPGEFKVDLGHQFFELNGSKSIVQRPNAGLRRLDLFTLLESLIQDTAVGEEIRENAEEIREKEIDRIKKQIKAPFEISGLQNQLAMAQGNVGDLEANQMMTARERADLQKAIAEERRAIKARVTALDTEVLSKVASALEEPSRIIEEHEETIAQQSNTLGDLFKANTALKRSLQKWRAGFAAAALAAVLGAGTTVAGATGALGFAFMSRGGGETLAPGTAPLLKGAPDPVPHPKVVVETASKTPDPIEKIASALCENGVAGSFKPVNADEASLTLPQGKTGKLTGVKRFGKPKQTAHQPYNQLAAMYRFPCALEDGRLPNAFADFREDWVNVFVMENPDQQGVEGRYYFDPSNGSTVPNARYQTDWPRQLIDVRVTDPTIDEPVTLLTVSTWKNGTVGSGLFQDLALLEREFTGNNPRVVVRGETDIHGKTLTIGQFIEKVKGGDDGEITQTTSPNSQ